MTPARRPAPTSSLPRRSSSALRRAGTINLTSLGTDTESDIQSNTFGNLSAPPAGPTAPRLCRPIQPRLALLGLRRPAQRRCCDNHQPGEQAIAANHGQPGSRFGTSVIGFHIRWNCRIKLAATRLHQVHIEHLLPIQLDEATPEADPILLLAWLPRRYAPEGRSPLPQVRRRRLPDGLRRDVGETLTAGSLTVTGLTSGFCYRWIVTSPTT